MTFVVGMLVDHESNGGLTNNVLVPRAFEWSHKCVPTTIPWLLDRKTQTKSNDISGSEVETITVIYSED